MQAIRFNDTLSIVLKVEGESVGERIATVKQFLNYLDGMENIDVSAVFEHSRIVVTVDLAIERKWNVDFHLVWPEPRMNNQHFNSVKLMNWIASYAGSGTGGAFNTTSASDARKRAYFKIQDAIGSYIDSGISGNGRIVLLSE
jgi:hypothetical protein